MPTIEALRTQVFTVPTDLPGGDGTASWEATTMVLVEVMAGPEGHGLGYTYGSPAAAAFVHSHLATSVLGANPDHIGAIWSAMTAQVRNAGLPGVGATAISAVDLALWDLKARNVEQPLWRHLGAHRQRVLAYGSGGLTPMTVTQLQSQLSGWVESGMAHVKMKIGTDWGEDEQSDLRRVMAAREAIGAADLMVDANGAYTLKQARRLVRPLADRGVTYFEEPVSSDRLQQLALLRQDSCLQIAAGEYGYTPWYFHRMLHAEAVDVLQADATRCLGATGWLQAAALAYAAGIPLSAHCAPAIHTHLGCAAPQIAHIEYFHDHARLEQLLFDGASEPQGGYLIPDASAPGLGLKLRAGADRFRTAAQMS
ncbi:MAG: enolase C-terminal domain-like protein [Candidatus Dormibacteraceae bacterium]